MYFADINYPLPEPGRSATESGSIFSGGQSVKVTMDINYPDIYHHTYFRVLKYNRSNKTVNSDCSCYEQCEWAKLSCQQINNHPSCQLITSQPGIYQFQVKTEHFPCYLDIGDPFNVIDINKSVDRLTLLPPCDQKNKVVYIIHYSDSKEWITRTLKPILNELPIQILTIEDAVAGQTIANARNELVDKADKLIVVFSSQSKENKKSLESKWLNYDLEHAKHKDPDPANIHFIPILYGDTKQEDLPKPLNNIIPLKADSKQLKDKLKESIFREKQ